MKLVLNSSSGSATPQRLVRNGEAELPDMPELSRYIFLMGALPCVVLGIAHVLVTPLTPAQSKGLSPRNPALRETMTRETALLSRRLTLWQGWVGFNLSHSLGVLLFGAMVLLVGRSQAPFGRKRAYSCLWPS